MIYLFLNLLFLVHIIDDIDSFSEFLCEFTFHIQSELGESSEERRYQ